MDLVKIISNGKKAKKNDEEIIYEISIVLLERLKSMEIEELSKSIKDILINPATKNYQILIEIFSSKS